MHHGPFTCSAAGWIEAVKTVEIEAGQVHVFRALRCFQAVKTGENALMKLGIDIAGTDS